MQCTQEYEGEREIVVASEFHGFAVLDGRLLSNHRLREKEKYMQGIFTRHFASVSAPTALLQFAA